MGQVLIKQLKNRYNSATVNRKFIIGIDRSKMKLFDVKREEYDDLSDSNQEDNDVAGNGFDFRPSKFKADTSGWKL